MVLVDVCVCNVRITNNVHIRSKHALQLLLNYAGKHCVAVRESGAADAVRLCIVRTTIAPGPIHLSMEERESE